VLWAYPQPFNVKNMINNIIFEFTAVEASLFIIDIPFHTIERNKLFIKIVGWLFEHFP